MEELEGSQKVVECGSDRELGGPQREIQEPCTGLGVGDLVERQTGKFYALSNVLLHCVGGMGWLEGRSRILCLLVVISHTVLVGWGDLPLSSSLLLIRGGGVSSDGD